MVLGVATRLSDNALPGRAKLNRVSYAKVPLPCGKILSSRATCVFDPAYDVSISPRGEC